jgi:hypothetical protein
VAVVLVVAGWRVDDIIAHRRPPPRAQVPEELAAALERQADELVLELPDAPQPGKPAHQEVLTPGDLQKLQVGGGVKGGGEACLDSKQWACRLLNTWPPRQTARARDG